MKIILKLIIFTIGVLTLSASVVYGSEVKLNVSVVPRKSTDTINDFNYIDNTVSSSPSGRQTALLQSGSGAVKGVSISNRSLVQDKKTPLGLALFSTVLAVLLIVKRFYSKKRLPKVKNSDSDITITDLNSKNRLICS